MKEKYKCNNCSGITFFPINFLGGRYCKECESEDICFMNYSCPVCNKTLIKKYEGHVCKNSKCAIGGFKNGLIKTGVGE